MPVDSASSSPGGPGGPGGPGSPGPTDRAVALHFVNSITPQVAFLVQDPILATGAWTRSPSVWHGVVGWQESEDARAEGTLPGGVQGSVKIRIGTMRSVSTLRFISKLNDQRSDIDGSQTKFIYDPDTGLFFTAVVSAVSSGPDYRVTLAISGGLEDSRLVGQEAPGSTTSRPTANPTEGRPMHSSSTRRQAPLLGSAAIQLEVHIANFIDKDTTLLLQDPRLLQGQWVGEAPNNFSEVGWQEQQDYYAEGKQPRGVDGSLTVRNSGTPSTARLIFKRNINEMRASFDGNEATPGNPYEGTWAGQKITLDVDGLQGNKMIVTLTIGNEQP